jgi:hypothetical protein
MEILMSKYKKASERIVEDFVSALFRTIGKGMSPGILRVLKKKDPKFGDLLSDLEKSREKVNSYVKQRTGRSSLSKSDIKAIKRGERPSWAKKL